VRHSRGEMYMVTTVCVFVCLSPHYCTDPDVTLENGRMCPPVVHYWAYLQSVHEFRCYDNVAPNAKCQRALVLAVCLVLLFSLSTPGSGACRLFGRTGPHKIVCLHIMRSILSGSSGYLDVAIVHRYTHRRASLNSAK